MHPYLQASLRAFIWSIAIAFFLNYLISSLNPFLGSVVLLLTLLVVLIYLFTLRKKGWRYVAIFLLCLVGFTSLFVTIDDRFFEHKRRYYAIQ